MSRSFTGSAAALAIFTLAATAHAQDVINLNEIYASHAGTDDQEFVELQGTPGMSLDYKMVLIVEGDSTGAGTLDRAWALTGAMPVDGYFVLGVDLVPNLDLNIGTDNAIENGTETFYLVDAVDQAGVDAVTALLGTNVDLGGGVTSIPTVATIIDIIGMIDGGYPATDQIYDGADMRGPDGTYFPPGIFRGADYPNDWCDTWLDYDDDANLDRPRTPGTANSTCAEITYTYALNELYVSHAGTDDQEFVELIGTPDAPLDYLMVLVVEGDSTGAGTLDAAWALTGTMPSDGFFVLGNDAVANLDLSIGADNAIENGTETIYLVDAVDQVGVDAITALLGTLVDLGGGVTVIPTMSTILDVMAMVDSGYPVDDQIYDGADFRGPDGTYFPPGIFRGMDYPNDWCDTWLDYDDDANVNRPRTPGEANSTCQLEGGTFTLNELYVSHASTDDMEFVEILGTPFAPLDYLMVLVVEGEGGGAGTLDKAWDLTGYQVPDDGYFVLGDTLVANMDFDLGADNAIENGTETIYLVNAIDQAGVDAVLALLGTDIDPDDDGITLLPGMVALIDVVGIVEGAYPVYDQVFDNAFPVGPDGSYLPAGIFRDGSEGGAWNTTNFLDYEDERDLYVPRTPGEPNRAVTLHTDLGMGWPANGMGLDVVSWPGAVLGEFDGVVRITDGPSSGVAFLLYGPDMALTWVDLLQTTLVPDLVSARILTVVLDGYGDAFLEFGPLPALTSYTQAVGVDVGPVFFTTNAVEMILE